MIKSLLSINETNLWKTIVKKYFEIDVGTTDTITRRTRKEVKL